VKNCNKCGELKELVDFYNLKTSEDGKQHRCKKCCNRRQYYENNKEKVIAQSRKWQDVNSVKVKNNVREWQKANPDKCRSNQLKSHYGITLEQMEQMFIAQNGRCGICDEEFINSKDMHVDHDHTTGKVRQLLCRKHNLLLGNCDENINILLKSIEYLQKWNKL
jgi:hypothetical protein